MIFRRKVELKITEYRPQLQILYDAAQELRLSSKFRQVLQVCLNTYPIFLYIDTFAGCSGCREYRERFHFSWRGSRFPTACIIEGISYSDARECY
jgi:hypothetical protein